MAVSTISPYTPPADLVSLKAAAEMFHETGHDVDRRTLKRWTVKHGVRTTRVGRDDHASWTDLLEIHAEEIDRREAARRP